MGCRAITPHLVSLAKRLEGRPFHLVATHCQNGKKEDVTAYIAGKGGFYFIVGGYVCYWILAPLMAAQGTLPATDPDELRLMLFRPVGIGMLIGGAITGIILFFVDNARSTDPDSDEAGLSLTPVIAGEGGGVSATLRF